MFLKVRKSYLFLSLSILMSFIFHCSEIPIKEIQSGKHLEKAKLSTIDHFLQKRMKNSIKKIIAHNTEIILEKPDFVYYGFVKGSNWDNLYVEEFFKISHSELDPLFPGYKILTGIEIKREIATSELFRVEHERTLIQNRDYRFTLTPDGLEAEIEWKYSIDGSPEQTKRFLFLLDPNTGKRISETVL